MLHQGQQAFEESWQIFVEHGPHHGMGARVKAHGIQVVGQGCCGMRVVRDIEHDGRLPRQNLKPSRPFHQGQPQANGLRRHRQLGPHGLEHRQHARSIQQLVGAAQGGVGQAAVGAPPALPGPLLGVARELKICADTPDIGLQAVGMGQDRCRR